MIIGESYLIKTEYLGKGGDRRQFKAVYLGEFGDGLYLFQHSKGYKECFLKKLKDIDYRVNKA